MYCEYTIPSINAGNRRSVFDSGDAAYSNRISLRAWDTTSPYPQLALGTGSSVLDLFSASFVYPANMVKVFAEWGSKSSLVASGSILSSSTNTIAVIPKSVFGVGCGYDGSAPMYGQIRNFKIWNWVLPDAYMQGMTR